MKNKKKTVVVFGTFDLLHDGHRDLFRQARKYGDKLIVVIARDRTVQSVKGRKPRNSECIRYWSVAREQGVDAVELGSLGDKYAVLEKLRPDVVCIGYDQLDFVMDLGSELVKRGLEHVSIKKLESYYPEQYKSSKLNADEFIITRAKQYVREIMTKKNILRTSALRKRASLAILRKTLALPLVQEAQTISIFISIFSEVDTKTCIAALRKSGKTVVVPKLVEDGYMKMSIFDQDTQLKKNTLGFFEPGHTEFYEDKIDLCIMSCMACDEKGGRLGRGMGYYDKFLSTHDCGSKMILAFEDQVLSCVPTGKYDKPVDVIVTEKRIIQCHS